MLSMVRRGARSIPNSATGRTASGLERAFITMGSAALRGVLRRRSAVTMAGSGTAIVSRPVSTSRVTSSACPATLISEANVACGRLVRAASIWPT
ncbi:hypothetical protein D9M68_897670 [compost metagenome]